MLEWFDLILGFQYLNYCAKGIVSCYVIWYHQHHQVWKQEKWEARIVVAHARSFLHKCQ